ncbi:hypothetical protein [Streptomyces sp. C1-2]|uniref:hypothetical protein n=1 Tax=Streptomyces sp. C1-2 TaxID=2720022 RepID=UPI0014323B41|nr:hypothetical protein [Streptomyces sp. C1-2]NJP70040.1 hypothetical protein [Streptomyces sp. C1-2]
MARMWTTGFELQSTTEFAVNSGAVVTGSPSFSTSVHRAGAASLRSNPTAATAFVEHQLTSGVVMRTMHRLYLRVDALPSTATNIYGIGQSGYFPALLRLQTDGTLVLRDGFTETTLTGTSPALTLGTWYRIELDYNDVDNGGVIDAGLSAFKAYLDGVQFADTMCSNITGFSRVRMGVQLAATTDIYIDDVAVNDTTGTTQNGLPGAGSVVHLRPNAAGDANGWATAVGGTAGVANNYTRVNEVPPNDATSYNQTTATGTTTTDDFNIDSPAGAGIGASDSITLVQVGGRVGSSATTTASLVYRLKGQASGTVSESASVSVAVNGWATHKVGSPFPYQLTSYTNPQTGTAWTRAALENAQIGYRSNVSQSSTRRVTNLWALVEFQPSAGTSQALGLASETGAAQAAGRAKARAQTPAGESAAAQALGRRKTLALGTALEAAAGQAVGRRRARALATAIEADAAAGLGRRIVLGLAAEAGAGQVLGRVKRRALTGAAGTETAQPAGRAKRLPLTAGTDSTAGQALGRRKTRAAGLADSMSTARPLAATKTLSAGTAGETAAALPVEAATSVTLGTAEETSTALTASTAKSSTLGLAVEETLAGAAGWSRSRALPLAVEETETQPVTAGASAPLPRAGEAGSAQPVGRAKRTGSSPAVDTAAAEALGQGKRLPLGQAAGTSTALSLTGSQARPFGTAREETGARPLTGTKTIRLETAGDETTAQAAGGGKAAALAPAQEIWTARLLPGAKARPLTPADEVATGLGMTPVAVGALTIAETTTAARPLIAGKRIALGPAREIAWAGVGPYTRLTPATDEAAALPLTGRRQRPADRLTSGTHGPQLTPGQSGPVLAAGSSGPRLTASTTTGGE